MLHALLSGTHIKKDNTVREWECVEYEGSHNGHMVRVIEGGKIKQIDMDTFTGIVLAHEEEFIYRMGKIISQNAYCLPF